MTTNVGRASGLIPFDVFVGRDAVFGRSDNAAFREMYGDCKSPVSIHFGHLSRNASKEVYYSEGTKMELKTDTLRTLAYRVRCWKCPPCRANSAWKWAQRGITEFNAAPRTWFGTFTISEEFLERCWANDRNEVIDALYEQGASENDILAYTLSELPPLHSQERRRIEAYFVDRELTKMWKRLRKAGFQLRYVVTTEFGSRKGRLHYHALVHCTDDLTRRRIASEWEGENIGHARLKLCKSNTGAHYVAKYVSKDGGTFRIKASIRYGDAERASACWRSLLVAQGSVPERRPEGTVSEASVDDLTPQQGEMKNEISPDTMRTENA